MVRPALFVVLGAGCLAPALVGLLRGTLDVFEPVHAYALSKLIYFVVVPLVLLRRDDFRLEGISYAHLLPLTLVYALLALVGFYLGYYWHRAPSPAPERFAATRARFEASRGWARRWAVVLLGFFSLLVALWIIIARIPLSALWIFGDAAYGTAWEEAQGPQIGYLYGAREALPACVLLLIATRRSKRWSLPSVALLFFVTIFFAGSGGRFRVMLAFLGAVIFFYLERRTRPRLVQVVLVLLVFFYLVIGAVGFYRVSTRTISDEFTLDDAWTTFVDGSQIAVSTALVVGFVPEKLDYLRGASFFNLLTQPIPRFLWPGKPTEIAAEIFDSLWPRGTATPFWSLFYVNFGPPGIVLGMMLFGFVSRRIYDAARTHPGDPFAQVALAVFFPMMIHIYGRGGVNPAFIVYGAVYVLLPVWMLQWLVARHRVARPQSLARVR